MSNDTSMMAQPKTARDKIRSLSELEELAATLRSQGRRVVLCHGVFDLLHMGHVRHFEVARREGDILIVTLTADRYVNKGPGRPIFTEQLRAEMVAAVGYVDWVGINHAQSAETVLRAVKPDVYVKGSDYENPEEDITGKITAERNVVEEHGGRLMFTKDITFSSSNLINSYLDVYDPPLRDFLDNLRQNDGLQRITDMFERIKDYRVLIVGDAIIDEYQYVSAMERASKEALVATLFKDREVFAGGVFATANHVADFCAEVEIVTVLGDDQDEWEPLIRANLKPNVKLTLIQRKGAPTTRKCRFIEPVYLRKMFEVYHMKDTPAPVAVRTQIDTVVAERAADFDVVIVNDFGHAMIETSTIDGLAKNAKFLAVNTQTNASNLGFNLITRYAKANYICIDEREARLALADKFSDNSVLAGEGLPSRVACDAVAVTCGTQGAFTWRDDEQVTHVPAFTKTVIDTVGAGDAFLAVTAPLVAAGANMDHVGFIGNAAGAMKVGIVGHRKSVEKAPLVKFITALLK